jgi:hypothetical protein
MPCRLVFKHRLSEKHNVSIYRDEVKMKIRCFYETLGYLQTHTVLQRRRWIANAGSHQCEWCKGKVIVAITFKVISQKSHEMARRRTEIQLKGTQRKGRLTIYTGINLFCVLFVWHIFMLTDGCFSYSFPSFWQCDDTLHLLATEEVLFDKNKTY